MMDGGFSSETMTRGEEINRRGEQHAPLHGMDDTVREKRSSVLHTCVRV
jgi:hypothetical protein